MKLRAILSTIAVSALALGGVLVTATPAAAATVVVFTATPGPYGIGQTVTFTATIEYGAVAPTGDVVFRVQSGPNLATGTLHDGIATANFVLTDPITNVEAHYAGDANFEEGTSDHITFEADRAAAIVTLEDPGVIPYGDYFYLTANVTIVGGLTPTEPVSFFTQAGVLIGTAPVIDGQALLQVCAAVADDCSFDPPLGENSASVYATYPLTAQNIEGRSPTLTITIIKFVPFTVTVTATPSTVTQGAAVTIVATVTVPSIPGFVMPGSVLFQGGYFLNGQYVDNDLADVPLVNGVATIHTQVGPGTGQIHAPTTMIWGTVYPDDETRFDETGGHTAIVVLHALSLTVQQPTIVAGKPVDVRVELSRDPGVTDPLTELVVVKVDGVFACQTYVTPGEQSVSCPVPASMLASGSHLITAHYPGDDAHAPSDSEPITVVLAALTPGNNPPRLAATGSTVGIAALLPVLLLGVGALAVAAGRRRRSSRSS